MHRSRLALLAAVGLVLLSGCTLPESPDRFDTDRELGYVGDYAHDDTFEFDASDGVTESQLEAVKYRSMARIEVVRGLKFHHDVDLEVITRAEYRDRRGESEPASPFVDEVWRGAFVVDGETDVNRAMDDLYGGSVQGYYVDDRIVIVADDDEEIRIDRTTLVHELVHALQDQRFGIARDGETIDANRAELGLIEGEANYLPTRYDRRCGEEWQCLPDYDRSAGEVSAGDGSFNVGLYLSIYAPYAEGPSFVEALRERGGWDAVDRAHGDRPASTSQLLHPERYPDDGPVDVSIPDRSSDEWDPIARDGEPRTETIGEATLAAALWSNGAFDRSIVEGGPDGPSYNYSYPATDGWAGDSLRVYRSDDGERTGHVWKLAWGSEADAAAFADAYRTVLENRGATAVDGADGVYRIADGRPFEGAYRVTVDGDAVTIVGAPTVDALAAIHGAGDASLERVAAPSPPSPAGPTASDGTTPAAGPESAAATASADG